MILLDEAYLSKVTDDQKSEFTRMEVLDLIYHQFLFNTNSLRRQPTISQCIQHLTLQTLARMAAAIGCTLLDYGSGKMVTIMISQDEY